MSGRTLGTAVNTTVIFTCLEQRHGRRWRYICQAWGEAIASGPARSQAEARRKNREAKVEYLQKLEQGVFAQTTAPDPRHTMPAFNRVLPKIDRDFALPSESINC